MTRAIRIDLPARTESRTTQETPPTLGELLTARRVRYGLDVLELSNRTRIRPDYLRALEADDLARLPERLLVKGYVRILEADLDFDAGKLEKALNTVWPLESVLWKPRAGFEFPWWLLGGVVSSLCVLALLGWGALRVLQAGPSTAPSRVTEEAPLNHPPATVSFSITTVPKGAKVYLDGGLVGLTPIQRFPATRRSSAVLKVQMDGHKPYQARLQLNQARSLKFALERLPQKATGVAKSNLPSR